MMTLIRLTDALAASFQDSVASIATQLAQKENPDAPPVTFDQTGVKLPSRDVFERYAIVAVETLAKDPNTVGNLVAAMEGEFDGLAVEPDKAREILAYVLGGEA